MIGRKIKHKVQVALNRQAAVALIGPRQVGKTTLAHEIAKDCDSIYLDLESSVDKAKLTDPQSFLNLHENELVVLDEIHRLPEIFQELRGIIDNGRRKGNRHGRFLILGSASINLLKQSGESLAGRIEYVDLGPLSILETGNKNLNRLWLQGGFPDSFLANSEQGSMALRDSFIRTYLERDVPMFGPRVPAETLERLWTMLGHNQGGLLNASKFSASLGVSSPTITKYLDLLVDLLLVRRLPPFYANTGKRLVKSPKVYIRDTGLLHALLGIVSMDDLMGHPVIGGSWEGFVVENLLAAAPLRTRASFYRTSAGAEIDLVLELGGNHGIWVVEIKRSSAPKVEKGFFNAIQDLKPDRAFVVYSGDDRYPLSTEVEAISLYDLSKKLESL